MHVNASLVSSIYFSLLIHCLIRGTFVCFFSSQNNKIWAFYLFMFFSHFWNFPLFSDFFMSIILDITYEMNVQSCILFNTLYWSWIIILGGVIFWSGESFVGVWGLVSQGLIWKRGCFIPNVTGCFNWTMELRFRSWWELYVFLEHIPWKIS